jgi:hypothetical protein
MLILKIQPFLFQRKQEITSQALNFFCLYSDNQDLSFSSSSKQVIRHKACYNLTEEFSHHLFIEQPKDLSCLVDSEGWLQDYELYTFTLGIECRLLVVMG